MMQNWSSFHQAGCSCLLTNQRPPQENSNCGEKHILHWLTKYHKIWVGRCMLCRFSIHILRIYKHHTLFYDHWFPLDKPSKPEFRSRHMCCMWSREDRHHSHTCREIGRERVCVLNSTSSWLRSGWLAAGMEVEAEWHHIHSRQLGVLPPPSSSSVISV